MSGRAISVGWLIALAMTAVLVTLLPEPATGQTQQTRQVMRQKLAASERLLAALVTSNWAELDRNGRALEAVTNQPGWDVMRMPEYAKYTAAFRRATEAVVDTAGARDQTTALTAYTGLVASCVACHGYVARSRIARH